MSTIFCKKFFIFRAYALTRLQILTLDGGLKPFGGVKRLTRGKG